MENLNKKQKLQEFDSAVQKIYKEYVVIKENENKIQTYTKEYIDSRYDREFLVHNEARVLRVNLEKFRDVFSRKEYQAIRVSLDTMLEAIGDNLETLLRISGDLA